MSSNVRSDRDINEETPLRRSHFNNNNNNNNTNNNNNQQIEDLDQLEVNTFDNIQRIQSSSEVKMDDSMKILIKLIIDFVILLCGE